VEVLVLIKLVDRLNATSLLTTFNLIACAGHRLAVQVLHDHCLTSSALLTVRDNLMLVHFHLLQLQILTLLLLLKSLRLLQLLQLYLLYVRQFITHLKVLTRLKKVWRDVFRLLDGVVHLPKIPSRSLHIELPK